MATCPNSLADTRAENPVREHYARPCQGLYQVLLTLCALLFAAIFHFLYTVFLYFLLFSPSFGGGPYTPGRAGTQFQAGLDRLD